MIPYFCVSVDYVSHDPSAHAPSVSLNHTEVLRPDICHITNSFLDNHSFVRREAKEWKSARRGHILNSLWHNRTLQQGFHPCYLQGVQDAGGAMLCARLCLRMMHCTGLTHGATICRQGARQVCSMCHSQYFTFNVATGLTDVVLS